MGTVRILAIADEIDDSLGPQTMASLRPNIVVSCGDLPADYLEYIVTIANVPLLWVPGNHDPDYDRMPKETLSLLPIQIPFGPAPIASRGDGLLGPTGCIPIDRHIVEEAGLAIGGLGGSVRYRKGPNQFTQRQMRKRARRLELRARLHRPRGRLDVLVTHAPPLGVGDADDPAHQGFAAFHRVIDRLSPQVLLHGHVHPHGGPAPERRVGRTKIVNAIPRRLIEVET